MSPVDLPDCCPSCGYVTQCVSNITGQEDARPRPGDFTVCIRCAKVLVFNENLKMRFPTGEELLEIAGNLKLKREIETIRAGIVMFRHAQN